MKKRDPSSATRNLLSFAIAILFPFLSLTASAQISERDLNRRAEELYAQGVSLQITWSIQRNHTDSLPSDPVSHLETQKQLVAFEKIVRALRDLPGYLGDAYAGALENGTSPAAFLKFGSGLNPKEAKRTIPWPQTSMSDFAEPPVAMADLNTRHSYLQIPTWLNTWHPILKPPAMNPLVNGLTWVDSKIDRNYHDKLQRFAVLTAEILPTVLLAPGAASVDGMFSVYRAQMELAVVYVTYVLPFEFVLDNNRWVFQRAAESTLQKYFQTNSDAGFLKRARAIWNDPSRAALRGAVAKYPREVLIVMLDEEVARRGVTPTNEISMASVLAAESALNAHGADAANFVRSYGYTLLAAMYEPDFRTLYNLPWIPDGPNYQGRPFPTRVPGAAWYVGYKEIVKSMNGYLEMKQQQSGGLSLEHVGIENPPTTACSLFFKGH